MNDDSVVPRSVAWLWTCRDALLAHWRPAVLGAVVLGLVLAGVSGLSTIESGETGVRLRFGRLHRADLPSGLNLSLPTPVDRVVSLDTSEVQRLTVESELGQLPDFVTGDENLVRVSFAVQYRIADAARFLFASEDVESLLEHVLQAALVETVASFAVDDLLTSAKALVQQRVRARAQDRLEALGTGMALVAVNLRSAAPPREAAEAFREVVDARARSAERQSARWPARRIRRCPWREPKRIAWCAWRRPRRARRCRPRRAGRTASSRWCRAIGPTGRRRVWSSWRRRARAPCGIPRSSCSTRRKRLRSSSISNDPGRLDESATIPVF